MQEGDDGKPIKPRQKAIKNVDIERFGGRRLKTLASVYGDPRRVSAREQTVGHAAQSFRVKE